MLDRGELTGGLLPSSGDDEGGWAGALTWALARMVAVMEGMRGTVTSRARALYRRICDVALKSPSGSAVTIMTPFWGLRRPTEEEACAAEGDRNEFEKRSSVSLHCRNGTRLGWDS